MIRTIVSMFLLLSVAATASAAFDAFLKMDGVKGETTKGRENTPNNKVKSNEAPKPAGLLVPAVQKARDAASSDTKKKGNVEYEWNVEKGD